VAAVDLIRGGAHTLRNKAFQIRVDGAVILAHDVPTRLRLPGCAFNLLIEQIGIRHAVESLAVFPKASAREEGSMGRFKMTLIESPQG